MSLGEDELAQKPTAEYFANALGWDSVYAFNTETFGPGSLLGRASDREVVLTRDLDAALRKLNPGLPDAAYDDACRRIVETGAGLSLLQVNQEKYELLTNGVVAAFRDEHGALVRRRLQVIDFENPGNNRFLLVRELWVRGEVYRRRADMVGFVNGLPLLFIECKAMHKALHHAYQKNLADYRDTIPHVFHHNALVLLGNGSRAKIGSITSRYEHFHEWKRLHEEEPGVVDMETLLKGVCARERFLDLVENFILFDHSGEKPAKIIGRNHQVLGVNRALQAVVERKERLGKLGVFWHTQGSGKSYSMVFFTRKVHRKLAGSFTFLICTDRDDLDGQIYSTYAGCGVVENDRERCRAASGEDLRNLLGQHKPYVFTLIQKFSQDVRPDAPWSLRDDVIVISDEAHRTQYGRLALNLRTALPHAGRIGFTGTPLFTGDEITKQVFGDYVSTYDFQRAVHDQATVPLHYDARGEKLGIEIKDLSERVAAALEDALAQPEMDVNAIQRLQRDIRRDYHVLTAARRLNKVVKDFVRHYATAWESGKAMLVCIDKVTCVRMLELIRKEWQQHADELEKGIEKCRDEQEAQHLRRQVRWMRDTVMAVVISEEQGEVAFFKSWDLDVVPHRKLIKDGFVLPDGKTLDLETAYKRPEHPFHIVVVCAMWLTGFDVPCLSTLYLDKPLKAHTLMQAIARANRVYEGKNNGLIVDYCGILKNLRQALAVFAGQGDEGHGGAPGETDPTHPPEELLDSLREAIELVRVFLTERGAPLDAILTLTGFARNAAIDQAKNAANENDETRKAFEIRCREVFRKFKACLTFPEVHRHKDEYHAIDEVYQGLQDDRRKADITKVLRRLQAIVDEAVVPVDRVAEEEAAPYDISRIDFDKLRGALRKSKTPNTDFQDLKSAIEERLRKMLAQNPMRAATLQEHYEELVAAYNREKDRALIEQTFQGLLEFLGALDDETNRALREGLDEETLALFDLLRKEEMTAEDRNRVKQVARELLTTLKAEKLKIDQWRERESTRDAVRVTIRDFLYDDRTGLPFASYTVADVDGKTEVVFQHVYYAYPRLPSPIYGAP